MILREDLVTKMAKELPELTPPALQFLKVLKQFRDKPITLKEYSMMIGVSRRWLRYLVSELRDKGYIRVFPEHMKIYHKNACRYVFLDGEIPQENNRLIIIPSVILHEVPPITLDDEKFSGNGRYTLSTFTGVHLQ